MNLLNIKAVKEAIMKPSIDHLKNIKYIASLSDDETLRFIDIFTYGRIVGMQEERARRQGRVYEIPTLVDDVAMILINLINSRVIDLSKEEQECFLKDLALNIENKVSSDNGKRLVLDIIRFISKNIKKKAIN